MDDRNLQIERQSTSLRQQVEEKVCQAIAEGRFKPGDRLIERELCSLIGVGRTSIREALQHLEAKGLIANYPHRGSVVPIITYEEAKQLYNVRAILESYAGRLFAEKGGRQEIAALDKAVANFEDAVVSGDHDGLSAAKTAFYDCLITGSGNVIVRQLLTGLHNRINLLRMTSMHRPGRLRHSVLEIKEIAWAIRCGDGARAASACELHIEKAAEVALDYLRRADHENTEPPVNEGY